MLTLIKERNQAKTSTPVYSKPDRDKQTEQKQKAPFTRKKTEGYDSNRAIKTKKEWKIERLKQEVTSPSSRSNSRHTLRRYSQTYTTLGKAGEDGPIRLNTLRHA